MRRLVFVLLGLALLFSSVPAPAAVRSPESGDAGPGAGLPGRDWVPGEVVVQLRPTASRRSLVATPGSVAARVTESVGLYDVAVLELEDGVGVFEGVRALASHPAVASVTPNYLAHFEAVPDDPRFNEQWGMHNVGQVHVTTVVGGSPRGKPDADMDLPRAWEIEEGDPETVIAVVDTGVDIRHPDLDDSIWTNPGEIPGDDIDNDNNGFVDDVHGWDVAENDNTLVERDRRAVPYQHGTHIAGIIAAEKDNGRGVVGACPDCSIMPVKISKPISVGGPNKFMTSRLSDELEGLAYAQRMGADIVNASFGRARWIEVQRDAFVELGRSGVLSVVAAGNSETNLDTITKTATKDSTRIGRPAGFSYPAAYDVRSIVTVAASADHDQYGTFTNHGRDSVDMAAPGVDIFSTIPDGRYQLLSGTSVAAPHVAGGAGLLESHRPSLSPLDLKRMLIGSVDHPRRMSLRRAGRFGFVTRTLGRANAADALDASPAGDGRRTDGTIRGARRIRGRTSDRLRAPTDFNDVYAKRLDAGDRVEITLRSRRSPLDLFVWKPDTKDIWQLEEACFTGQGRCSLRAWEAGGDRVKRVDIEVGRAGTYYLHVSGRVLDRGRYKLTVDKKK